MKYGTISHTIMCLIGDSGRLNELKSVDLLVIECPKRAKSVINEVQARCNPYTEGSSGLRALSRPPYMLFRSIFWSLKIRTANGESNFQMQFLRKFSNGFFKSLFRYTIVVAKNDTAMLKSQNRLKT